jgi:hypothetical protein
MRIKLHVCRKLGSTGMVVSALGFGASALAVLVSTLLRLWFVELSSLLALELRVVAALIVDFSIVPRCPQR